MTDIWTGWKNSFISFLPIPSCHQGPCWKSSEGDVQKVPLVWAWPGKHSELPQRLREHQWKKVSPEEKSVLTPLKWVSGCVIDSVSSQPECVEKNLMEQWRKPAAPTRWKWCSSPTLPTWTEASTQSFRLLMPATVSDSLSDTNVLWEAGLWNPVIHSLSKEIPVQKSALHQTGAQMRRLERLRRHERRSQLQWALFTLTRVLDTCFNWTLISMRLLPRMQFKRHHM